MYYGFFGPLPKPDKWVFIVGCNNSGTTLLHDIIARHRLVGSMPWEGEFYTDQLKRYWKRGVYARIWATEPEHYRMEKKGSYKANPNRLKRQWGGRFNDWTRPILLEKSPSNTGRVQWLQEHFENAHFIGMIRNCYAVAEGVRRKVKHDIRTAAKQWVKGNEFMLADFEQLERTKIIRYEDFTENPDKCVREVCEFIGIDPDEISVEGKWNIRGKVSTIKNMNHLSFERLSEEDCRIIEEEAGDMLEKLNYPRQVSG